MDLQLTGKRAVVTGASRLGFDDPTEQIAELVLP